MSSTKSTSNKKLNMKLLLALQIDDDDTDEEESIDEMLKHVEKLLNRGADVNVKDANDSDNTPLHLAVKNGNRQLVELLISREADVNIKNSESQTPFDIAQTLREVVHKEKQAIIKILENKLSGGPNKQINSTESLETIASGTETENLQNSIFQKLPVTSTISDIIVDFGEIHIPSRDDSVILKNQTCGNNNSGIVTDSTKREINSENEKKNTDNKTTNVAIAEVSESSRKFTPFGEYIENQPKPYSTSGAKDMMHGFDYQMKLLVLYMCRGLNSVEQYAFRLATEMDDADKFDDVVFHYAKNGIPKYRFLQAKHKQGAEKKIGLNDLIVDKEGQYSLHKYFRSFLKIKENPVFKDATEDFIICTNCKFKYGDKRYDLVLTESIFDECTDDVLNNRLYRFKNNFPGRKQIVVALRDTNFVRSLRMPQMKIERLINDFMFQLKFAVDQPSDLELEQMIKTEVAKFYAVNDPDIMYNCIFHRMFAWFQEKEGKFLTRNDGLEFFTNTGDMMDKLKVMGLSKYHTNRIDEQHLKYNEIDLSLCDFLTSHISVRLVLVPNNETILSLIRIQQTLSTFKTELIDYTKDDSYVILNSEELINHEKIILKAFRVKSMNLLIVDCQNETKLAYKTIRIFEEIIKTSSGKKILVVASKQNETLIEYLSDAFHGDLEKTEAIVHFQDFVEISRNIILKKPLRFQGHENCLGSIVDENIIDIILEKAIVKGVLIIGNELDTVNESYLVERQLVVYRRLDMKVLNDTTSFFVALISGQNYIFKLENDTFVIDDNIVEESYRTIVETRQVSNVHWCIENGNDLVWVKSRGPISELRKYIDYCKPFMPRIETLFCPTDRIILLCSDAGMGKTTYLKHIAHKTKLAFPSAWIIYVPLNSYTEYMHKNEITSEDDAIEFLLHVENLHNEFERMLLWNYLQKPKRVAVIFDGFDEISPLYKEKVIRLIQLLEQTRIEKIWVSTRTHMQHEIEDLLSCLSFNLIPFAENDQKEFLFRYWQHKVDQSNENRVKTFIDDLLKRTDDAFCEDMKYASKEIPDRIKEHMTTIELILKVILFHSNQMAEHSNISNWVSSENIEPEINSNFFRDLTKSKVDNFQEIKTITADSAYMEIVSDVYVWRSTAKLIQRWADEPGDHKVLISLQNLFSSMKEYLTVCIDDFDNFERSLQKRKFTEIPLQLRLVAEAFLEHLVDFLATENTDPALPETFGMLYLYERFVRSKHAIYREEKKKESMTTAAVEEDNEYLYQKFVEDHRIASVASLFSDTVDKLFGEKEFQILENFKIRFNDGKEKTGIISMYVGETFQFVHRNFAEYFSASWLHEILISDQCKFQVVRDFMKETLFETRNETIRYFFDLFVVQSDKRCQNIDILNAVLYNDRKRVIDNTRHREKTCVDRFGRNAVHLAAAYGYSDIIEILIEHEAIINTKDTLFNWTPLKYAVATKMWRAAEVLLKNNAKVDNEFENIENKENVLNSLIENGHINVILRMKETNNNSDAFDMYNETLVHRAVQFNQIDMVKELSADGIDIDAKSESLLTPLHWAARNGNLNVVMYLVSNGAEVDPINKFGKSPLYWAAINGHLDVVKYLCSKGADINIRTSDEKTPLHWAARNGHDAVVSYLIENGANVNAYSSGDLTPLHCAADGNSVLAACCLIDAGADINATAENGITPLHLSTVTGHLDMVKFLISKNALIDSRTDKTKDTPAHLAAVNGRYSILKFLIESGADSQAINSEQSTLLHLACNKNNIEMIKYLIDIGCDINARRNQNCTPLATAIQENNLEVVKCLIENGADKNLMTDENLTPLHVAAMCGHARIVQYLLEKGCDVEDRSTFCSTPLDMAAINGHTDVVRILIENNADVNVKNDRGRTPLHSAIFFEHIPTALRLIQAGADLEALNNDEETPLTLACLIGKFKIASYLMDAGADIFRRGNNGFTLLHSTAAYGNLVGTKKLIEIGLDVHARDKSDATALHLASRNGAVDVVQYLLDLGADMYAQTVEGSTHLHLAANEGYLNVVKIFIERGMDVEVGTTEHCTPLQRAVLQNKLDVVKYLHSVGAKIDGKIINDATTLHLAAQNGCVEIVEYLITKGLDVNAKTDEEATPLHSASKNGNVDVIKILIENGARVDAVLYDLTTCLHLTSIGGHLTATKYFVEIQGCDFEARTLNAATCLHIAAHSGHEPTVKYLIDKGANLNVYTESKSTPLHLACSSGNLNVVKYLIDKNLDFEEKTFDGFTCIAVAAKEGHSHIVDYLISIGADVNTRGDDLVTPLHLAIEDGHIKTIELLIEKGISVNTYAHEKDTPLHWAAFKGHTNVAKCLLDRNAKITCLTDNRETPLHWAMLKGHLEISEFLIRSGVDVNARDGDGMTALHIAVDKSHRELVALLIKHGASVNIKSENDSSPLETATLTDDLDMIKLLIENGADINACVQFNYSALHFAVTNENIEIVEYLTRNGADLSHAFNFGITPLHLAIQIGKHDIAKFLIEAGADVNAMTEESLTPLHIAATEGNLEIVKCLVHHGADVNTHSNTVATPLRRAVDALHVNITYFLTQNGADLSIVQGDGRTLGEYALHTLQENFQAEITNSNKL